MMAKLFARTLLSGFVLLCGLAVASPFSGLPAALAVPSFQQGVADYSKGNYRQALATFQAYVAAFPNNVLAHYYVGVCQLGLRNRAGARAEFQWVMKSGDAKLVPLAQKALQQMGDVGSTYVAYSPPSSAGRSSAAAPGARVRKIIEFYADW